LEKLAIGQTFETKSRDIFMHGTKSNNLFNLLGIFIGLFLTIWDNKNFYLRKNFGFLKKLTVGLRS